MSAESIDTQRSNVALVARARQQCGLSMEYPFLTDIVCGPRQETLSTLFAEDDVIQTFARAFDEYEKKILRQYDATSVQVRKLLRWKNLPGFPEMPVNSTPTAAVHEECFSLVAGYALLDRWARLQKLENILPAQVVPKRLDMALLDSVKMPYFEELSDVTQLLRRAREYRALVQARPQIRAIATGQDLIAHHLNQMAFHSIRAETNYVLNNFRMAAFNLAFKLRGNTPTVGRLPNMPDKTQLEDSVYASVSNEDATRIKVFLKKIKPAQLRAVLDIVDAVTPLALLLPHPLSGHHVIGRENLLKIASSLGNDKHHMLTELELALYQRLIEVSLEGKDPDVALEEFLGSNISKSFDTLDPMHPAVTFFRHIDMVPSITAVQDRQENHGNEPGLTTTPPETRSTPTGAEVPNQLVNQERDDDRGQADDEQQDEEGEAKKGGDAQEGKADDDNKPEDGSPENERDAEGEDEEGTGSQGEGPQLPDQLGDSIVEKANSDTQAATDTPQHQPEEEVVEIGGTNAVNEVNEVESEAGNGGGSGTSKDRIRKSTRLSAAEKAAKNYKETSLSDPKLRKNKKEPKSVEIIEEEEDIKPEINYRSKYWEPIDVDLYVEYNPSNFEHLLNIHVGRGHRDQSERRRNRRGLLLHSLHDILTDRQQRIEYDDEFEYFKVDGSKHAFKPRVHTPEMLATFEELMAGVQAAYINGLPAFLSDAKQSGIFVTTHADFLQMEERTIQEHLHDKSIYITNCPSRKQNFRQAVMDVTSMQSVVDVQDLSLKTEEGESSQVLASGDKDNQPYPDKNKYLRRAAVKTIVNCIEKRMKILNALQFPLTLNGFTRSAYSSDSYALHETQSDPSWKNSFSPPSKDINWAVVSSQFAYHGIHGDAAGLGTKVGVNGKKLWLIGRALPEKPHIFSSINCYLSSKFNIDKANRELFALEALYLDETTTLIMRPGTPHAVITLEDSVTVGNHFYAMGSIQSTAFSMMHSFVLEKLTTNTSHPACMFLIRQLITFMHRAYIKRTLEKDDRAWNHVPDLRSVESLIDLLTLCNLGILHNAIDSETYTHYSWKKTEHLSPAEKEQLWKYDYNASTFFRRRAAIHTRGLALELIEWVDRHYRIKEPIPKEADKAHRLTFSCAELARNYLAQQCAALIRYKTRALEKGKDGVDNCTIHMLRHQIAGIFPLRNDPMRAAIVSTLESSISQMRLPDFVQPVNNRHHKEPVEIRKMQLVKIKPSEDTPAIDLLVRGLSALDIRYLAYTNLEDISPALNTLKKSGLLIELSDEYETREIMDAYDSSEIPPARMQLIHPRKNSAGKTIDTDDESDVSDKTYKAPECSDPSESGSSGEDDDGGSKTIDEYYNRTEEDGDVDMEPVLGQIAQNANHPEATEPGSSTEEEDGMDLDRMPPAYHVIRARNIEVDQNLPSDSDEEDPPVPPKRRIPTRSTHSSPSPQQKRLRR